MSVFTVTHVTRVDGYGVVQTLEPNDVAVGQSVTVAGLTNSTLNGTFTVVSVESYALEEVTDSGDLVFDYDFYYPNQLITPTRATTSPEPPTAEPSPTG